MKPCVSSEYIEGLVHTPFREMMKGVQNHPIQSISQGRSIPSHLYHYRSMSSGLKQLTNGTIRLATASDYQNGRFGDPMDTNPSTISPSYSEKMIASFGDDADYIISMEALFNERQKHQCTSKLRLSCMTDSQLYSNMWLNYAENYAGICIEYYEPDLFKQGFRFDWVSYYEDSYTWDERGSMDPYGNVGRTTRMKNIRFCNEHELRHAHFISDSSGIVGCGNEFLVAPKPIHVYFGCNAESKHPDLFKESEEYCRINSIPYSVVYPEETIGG